jgi:uncharacterized protein YecE (DUF72 family)
MARRGEGQPRKGRIRIGISGYDYAPWRGAFYPDELPRRSWLRYSSERFDSIELNGTFYSLKSPAVFRRWASEVPAPPFVFAIKGSRFITHNLKLRNAEQALGNFFASGVLALGRRTGPFLWQLPATYGFDAARMDAFMHLLPRDSRQAAGLAARHDDRLRCEPLTEATVQVRYRHAFEARHPSYFRPEFYDLLRSHRMGFVVADTAGKFPIAYEVTAPFVYVRLHGSTELYVSGYTDEELDVWAARARNWAAEGRDVYIYFDNDAKVHAPHDARRLGERLDARSPTVHFDGRSRRASARAPHPPPSR